MFFGVQFIKIFQMLFNKKYCFKNLSFFFSHPPHEKIVIRTESWVKNRDTNRIVGLVYRYSPNGPRGPFNYNSMMLSLRKTWLLYDPRTAPLSLCFHPLCRSKKITFLCVCPVQRNHLELVTFIYSMAIKTIYSKQYILRLYFMSCIRLLCKWNLWCSLTYDILLFPVRL